MELPAPTWFVGCGNMAQAMIDGWKAAHVDMASAVAIRPSGTPVTGMRTVTSVKDAGPAPRMIILGFKPQQLDSVAPELLPWLSSKTIIVSMLAGVEVASLRRRFSRGTIVRAIPNLPVAIRRGVVALHSDAIDDDQAKLVGDLFAALGFALWTSDEAKLAAIGSVAGAGPAYVARFIDALANAGVGLGLPDDVALTIARETVLGTAWATATSGEDMASLARRVASPGGTTEAGLKVLDEGNRLDQLVAKTIEAASTRGRSLAEEARLA
jgi:pyrroline-5-carboxylate reductase